MEAREKLLTLREVGAFLRVSRGTLYRLLRSGELQTLTVGRGRRVAPEALQAYLRTQAEGGDHASH